MLEKVSFDGVGSFKCHQRLVVQDFCIEKDGVGTMEINDLHCRDLSIQKDGVGGAEINVDCHMLEADIDGVGGITFSGKAQHATFEKNGVGGFRTSTLTIGGK